MNALVISMFVSAFSAGYLAQQLQVLPGYAVLVPELLSGVALLAVLLRVVGGYGIGLDWRYAAFLALFFFTLAIGFAAQSVAPGVIVSGLRNYVKYVPFFLLAASYPFTDRQLGTQLTALVGILLFQIPLSIFQRFVQFGDRMHTGDPIRGMATSSSALSLLMVCAIALLVSLYLRRKIKLPLLFLGIAAFMIPTTLNETKGTVVMLPVALLAPALFMPPGSRIVRRLVPVAAIGCVALAAFAVGYNVMLRHGDHRPIVEFFTEGDVADYVYTGAADGEDRFVGRVDSVFIAARMISADPFKLAFGFGAGNVSPSSLPGFGGRYAVYFESKGVTVTQVANFLWEIGFVGLFAHLLLYWFVFRDARLLSRTKGAFSIHGQVWGSIVVLMGIALMYKSVLNMNEIAYLFWYFSGLIARNAHVERTMRRSRETRRRRGRPASSGEIRRPVDPRTKLRPQWS